MTGVIMISMLVPLLIGSAFGGIILWQLAKRIGAISNATFGNSFIICLLSSMIYFVILYMMGLDAFKMGFSGLFLLNFILLSAAYIIIGKFIWKSDWIQSVKANIIWILVYAIFTGFTLSYIS